MLKISEISKLDSNAINQKVTELRRELFNLKLQKNTTNLESPHLLKILKRDIARLLTVANNQKVSK